MAKPKLRKMLCDINSQECKDMMSLIETQSKTTLATWAVVYAEENYETIYETKCPQDIRLRNIIHVCKRHLNGEIKLAELKPFLQEAKEIARDAADDPVTQAAARAVSTACAAIQTPTNTLGFLFYGAAAVAYNTAGLTETSEVYDNLALTEFRKAYESLKAAAVPDEPKPAKIKWGC